MYFVIRFEFSVNESISQLTSYISVNLWIIRRRFQPMNILHSI